MTGAAAEDRVDLARLWSGYSTKVYHDYPLYVALAAAVAADGRLRARLEAAPREAHDPNMLLAALQYLVAGRSEGGGRSTVDRRFAEMYAEPSDPPVDVAARLAAFCEDHWDEIAVLLASRHVQTNETGRGGGIALGLAEAATCIGEPLAVVDAGASAGLNLCLDEYLLDFGPAGTVGPPDSPVRVECRLEGPIDPARLRVPPIARRVGLDRAPVDPTDPDAVRWMLACVWPGRGRQERARAALALAAAHPGRVRKGDMVADLAAAMDEMAPHPTVVVTSWSYSYLPAGDRAAMVEVMGSRSDRPVAWLYMDLVGTEARFDPGAWERGPDGDYPSVLGLAVFDGGAMCSARALALMHSHGHWVRWLSP